MSTTRCIRAAAPFDNGLVRTYCHRLIEADNETSIEEDRLMRYSYSDLSKAILQYVGLCGACKDALLMISLEKIDESKL